MKKFLLSLSLVLLVTSFATAGAPSVAQVQVRRPFPVATGVGRAINRVVGFPFRVAAAAIGVRPRANVIVNTPVAQVRVGGAYRYIQRERIVVPYVQRERIVVPYVQQIAVRREHFVAPYVQQIAIRREQFVTPYVQQVVVQRQQIAAPYVQQVVGQMYTQTAVAPEVVQPQECTCPQVQTTYQQVQTQPVQKIILRQTTGQCGAVSQFRY